MLLPRGNDNFYFYCYNDFTPFFAAYATEDFFQRIQIYHEQPFIQYSNNYLIYVMASNADQMDDWFDSSYLNWISHYPGNKSKFTPTVTPWKDNENSSKNDKFEVEVDVNLPTGTGTVRNVKIILFFHYAWNDKVKLLMNTPVILDIDTTIDLESIKTSGMIKWKQRSPISSSTITNKMFFDSDILKVDNYAPYDYLEVVKSFQNRNYTTSYDYESVITPLTPSSTNSAVNVKMTIEVPKLQEIMYYQSWYDTLRSAWIQYIYIFIPIYIIIYFCLLFILENKIFTCSEKSDV